MTTPLYQPISQNPPPQFSSDSHRGLWYERFFNHYNQNQHWEVDKEGKTQWIIATKQSTCGDSETLTQHTQRLLQLVKTLGGDFRIFETSWHFATGLGLPHPVENGFSWHPTLGVPYLAGSGVKGLLRAWVEIWEENQERLKIWFGDEQQEQAGQLIFFDALPIKPVSLTADIMTPHAGDWYQEGNKINDVNTEAEKLPADWHDPVPVSFLAVKPNTQFLFMIAPRPTVESAVIDEAFDSLENALKWQGAGVKTAAGYGHMQFNKNAKNHLEAQRAEEIAKVQHEQEEAERKAANEQRKAQMSPLELSMEKVIENSKQQDQADYITLLQALDAGRWENDEDKKLVAQSIRERMIKAKVWKETTAARRPDRDKNYQKTQDVLKYL
jgi:CRISPR-associated protein Cmr6